MIHERTIMPNPDPKDKYQKKVHNSVEDVGNIMTYFAYVLVIIIVITLVAIYVKEEFLLP